MMCLVLLARLIAWCGREKWISRNCIACIAMLLINLYSIQDHLLKRTNPQNLGLLEKSTKKKKKNNNNKSWWEVYSQLILIDANWCQLCQWLSWVHHICWLLTCLPGLCAGPADQALVFQADGWSKTLCLVGCHHLGGWPFDPVVR